MHVYFQIKARCAASHLSEPRKILLFFKKRKQKTNGHYRYPTFLDFEKYFTSLYSVQATELSRSLVILYAGSRTSVGGVLRLGDLGGATLDTIPVFKNSS